MGFKQADRTEVDGQIGVDRRPDGHLGIRVTHNGIDQWLIISDYNAARLAGTLAFFIGVTKFGDLGKVSM